MVSLPLQFSLLGPVGLDEGLKLVDGVFSGFVGAFQTLYALDANPLYDSLPVSFANHPAMLGEPPRASITLLELAVAIIWIESQLWMAAH